MNGTFLSARPRVGAFLHVRDGRGRGLSAHALDGRHRKGRGRHGLFLDRLRDQLRAPLPLRAYTKNGRVIRIETDNTIKDGCSPRQLRACLKGRSMRQRLYSGDRLKYPMKRVGERGEGKFERISWDEALKTVAQKLKYTVETYGNEALYWQYCSGQQSMVNGRVAWWRLMNLMGGYLKYYGSYSTAQISAAFPMTYGGSPASDTSEIGNAKLYVAFGNNPLRHPRLGRREVLSAPLRLGQR